MNNMYNPYLYPYYTNMPMNNTNNMYNAYRAYTCPYFLNSQMHSPVFFDQFTNQYVPYADEAYNGARYDLSPASKENASIQLKDYGPAPFVINIEEATKQNNTFRTALWTGNHLQLTLMSLNVGEDIGLEMHPDLDQFIRIEEGQGVVKMGKDKNNLNFQREVRDDFIFIIPAGTWHNLINTGNKPLKLYSIYAPTQHPRGTVHVTKADAMAAEEHDHS